MDKFIDTRFERVEKALAALIDSISKYNPSTAHAHELATADRELSKGLLELQAHQNNHLRIQALRAAAAGLDAQIRDTLRTLASTRRDITTTATTTFPDGPSYPVAYDELLSYARRISKTTLPPGLGSGPAAAAAAAASPAALDDGGSTAPPTAAQTPAAAATPVNGAATPAGHPPGSAGTDSQQQQQQQQLPLSQASASTAAAAMPEPLAAYLNPLSGAVFVPWPAEDKIRAGSLASNQVLAEQGLDPRDYDPEEVARRQEEERRLAEERERLEREEEERRLLEQRARAERERAAREEQARLHQGRDGGAGAAARGPSAPAGQPEKKQFQFMGDLDDDDE